MRTELIEAKQELIAGYKMPDGRTGHVHFKRGETLTKVPSDVLAILRSKKGSGVEAALAAGVLVHVNGKQAQRMADGEAPFASELNPIPAVQLAAQTYADTGGDPDQALAAAEALHDPSPEPSRGRGRGR